MVEEKEGGVEKEQVIMEKLANLEKDGYLKGKTASEFLKELGGSTKVYAVYFESPTVDYPAEKGEHFTVDELDLATEDVPVHPGNSELRGVYTSREEAEKE